MVDSSAEEPPRSSEAEASNSTEFTEVEANEDPKPSGEKLEGPGSRSIPNEPSSTWLRIRSWIPRPSLVILLIAAAALTETGVLAWIQWGNYLAFIPTQGNLGNYNQALYTTIHGQGFFYYTTNIPEGSNGSIWAAHFAPDLFIILPIYAIAPSPVTLIVLKQLALTLGALPLYGIAKTYFRNEFVPILFSGLYLISPLTLTADWNTFDLEPLFPLALLLSLYFFSKGRNWPFLACWLLALGTIEATTPLLALFAAGGLIGTFLAKPSSAYWTAAQQRRPLFAALVIAVVWLGVAALVLYSAGSRGGGFGNAYAIRYTILGADSLPNVLPQAVTHPGAAAAALRFGESGKILFVELILISTGALWLLGGLRYILPIGGYLALALLSNNAGAYTLGTEQAVLLLGFLFAGTIEGAVLLSDWLGGVNPEQRHLDLRFRLAKEARELADNIRLLPLDRHSLADRLETRLRNAIVLLDADGTRPGRTSIEIAQKGGGRPIAQNPSSERRGSRTKRWERG